jgi:DNA repair protein SbcC/Rad50
MKILAIRGCNLASLAGEFEIDLAHGPLGGAGVFAIVGNTGAGKSTLLDALCVALFDRTPRLTNHSTVKVGRGLDDRALLGAQDVRTLLRRGAAQGWAEVDFESGDARQYRARWSVRRARGQSDGTLQDQQLSLTALAGGERLGGTKTETLKAIHARLGLSFDQFRRSALLAQGEFAAFLRADGKDRSELLERMTGTQIYSRLSIAAHQKAALADQGLRDRRAAALAISVLDDPAEAAIRCELARATADASEVRGRHAAAVEAARWLVEAARRRSALAEAAAGYAAARAGWAAGEADRAELGLRQRAERVRPAWDAVVRAERSVGIAAREAREAAAAAAAALGDLAAIAERRREIAAIHAPVRAARIAAWVVERVAAPGGALAIPGAVTDDAAWLTARAALAPEIAGWLELDARLAQHAALGAALAALDRALADHTTTRARVAGSHELLASEVKAAVASHETAKRKAASFAHKRGLTLDAARRLEDEARTRVGEIERLAAIAAAAREAAAAASALDRGLAGLAADAAEDAHQGAKLAAAREVAEALRSDQARVVAELRRAAGYHHARAELVEGEPCPLCGAAAHPWRDRGALDDVIASAEERLVASVAELAALARLAAALAARQHHRDGERARLAAQRAGLASERAAAIVAWRALLRGLGELMLVEDPASEAAAALAADRRAQAAQQLDAARAARSQTEAATKAAQDAQADVQLCQAALDERTGQLGVLARRIAELDAAIGQVRGERASKCEHHAALATEIGAALARWRAALPGDDADDRGGAPRLPGTGSTPAARSARGGPSDPGAAADTASRSPATRGGPGAAVRATPPPGPAAARGVDPALVLALVAQLQVSAPSRVAAAPREPLAIVRLAMAGVVEAWRARAERIADADVALTAAAVAVERAAHDVDRAIAEHAARRDDAERRCGELRLELAAATSELDAARGVAGFTPGELARLLDGDRSRVAALAERLAALDRAVDRARAVIGERERLVADHAATRPAADALDDPRLGAAGAPGDDASGERDPGLAPPRSALGPGPAGGDAAGRQPFTATELAAARVDALWAAVAAAERRAAQLAAGLAADVDARARRAAALAALAAAEAGSEVDRVLGEVIGSHDGKLFRSFAQSLTLDSLLAVANAHLEELAPRYQLERVPRHDLELQVIDRDLGSEVRSVQSLSGGESFLVSLALALGLSSMSAHDVRVRTLLIDEGFGTLDPATLDSALSVLDALQSTGRQVGVISHVPALVERVGAHVRVVQRGGGRSEVIVA